MLETKKAEALASVARAITRARRFRAEYFAGFGGRRPLAALLALPLCPESRASFCPRATLRYPIDERLGVIVVTEPGHSFPSVHPVYEKPRREGPSFVGGGSALE